MVEAQGPRHSRSVGRVAAGGAGVGFGNAATIVLVGFVGSRTVVYLKLLLEVEVMKSLVSVLVSVHWNNSGYIEGPPRSQGC